MVEGEDQVQLTTQGSCLLTSTHASWHLHAYVYMNTHTHSPLTKKVFKISTIPGAKLPFSVTTIIILLTTYQKPHLLISNISCVGVI